MTAILLPRLRSFIARTAQFADGSSTPRAFLEDGLEIAARMEPEIRAFAHLDIEGARRQADASSARWRDNWALSPIDGMPVGIKDIIETADMPTGMGSPLFDGWRSNRDAASVFALREAGAVIVGKTVTTEFAATEPGPTRNPWDPARTPGGSSSGSAAAVGAGILAGALGTQVIGSIVRPAGYCGCVGFKPTVGALNRGGSHDYLSQSVLGTLGATLSDAWSLAVAIAQRSGGDPGHAPLSGPTGMPPARPPRRLAHLQTAGWAIASQGARGELAKARACFEAAGCIVFDRSTSRRLDALEGAIVEARRLSQAINAWESRWPLNTYAMRDRSKLSRTMTERLAVSEAMNIIEYSEHLGERDRVRALYVELAAECDACVTLSAPSAAPLGIGSTGNPVFAVPGSLLGVPAVTLPLFAEEGLPLGLQVLGFAQRDADLFAVARWCEETWLAACAED
jgi:Asp-tRNA(Asn)/Glu-tRNA(Gln) amidotransferase A subunit family amidase